VLSLPAAPSDALAITVARGYLGRALVESRRDVAGGLAMARAVRAALVAAPDSVDDLRDLDHWLARHAR